MKTHLKTILLVCTLLFSFQSNAQVDTAWARTFGDVYWDEMHSVTTDGNNNVFVAGWTYYNSSDYDWAIAKYNSAGEQQWFKNYTLNPGSDIDATEFIASDQNGNVVAAGNTALNLLEIIKYNSLGDTVWTVFNSNYFGIYIKALIIDDADDIFIAGFYDSPRKGVLLKYSNNGLLQWVREFQSSGSGYCEFSDAVTDNNGNIYVTGRCEFDTAMYDALTIKYNSQGDTLWTRHWNGPGTQPIDEAVTIRLDAQNNLFIGGRTSPSLGSTENFATLRYDTAGNFQWERFFDGQANGNDGIVDMVVDDLGNVVVTGWSSGGPNNSDFETIKYNSSGDTLWTQRYGNSYNESPMAMITDADKNVFITGYGINAGGNGGWNGLVIKYDSAGVEKWIAEYDGNNNNGEDEFYNLMLDDHNDLIVVGRTYDDSTSYDFLIVKYQNSSTGIPLIETGNPDLHISCYPNPFANSANISYYIPASSAVTLKLLDLTGNEISAIVDGQEQAGNHTLQFNSGSLGSGIYFFRLSAGGRECAQKLIIIK